MVGVSHETLAGYSVSDINVVAAFDVDDRKVGLDLSDAIWIEPNCTSRYVDVDDTAIKVERGPRLDGIAQHMSSLVPSTQGAVVDVATRLRDCGVDVMLCYLPGGAQEATEYYADAALKAGVAFVNCNPDRIAESKIWQEKFSAAGLPLLGDDIKSQFGTTMMHRTILEACEARGVVVDHTYQIVCGGNTDFINMMDDVRFESKLHTKRASVVTESKDTDIVVTHPQFIAALKDKKVAYIRLEGRGFLGMNLDIELKLNVEDSPNSAGVVIDIVRAAKLALDRGVAGPVSDACAAFFKCPPVPCNETLAAEQFDRFVSLR